MKLVPEEDYLYEDILAGCVEILYRVGRLVFIEGGKFVGRIEDDVWPNDHIKYRVVAGDYRYGCCNDIILRPVKDKIHILLPKEGWFSASLNEKFAWEHGYIMIPINNWQTVIKKELAKHDAGFVFEELLQPLPEGIK